MSLSQVGPTISAVFADSDPSPIGFVQTIHEEGMPEHDHPSSHGDLYVEYNVVLPSKLSADMRKSESTTRVFSPLGTNSSLELAEVFYRPGEHAKDEL